MHFSSDGSCKGFKIMAKHPEWASPKNLKPRRSSKSAYKALWEVPFLFEPQNPLESGNFDTIKF